VQPGAHGRVTSLSFRDNIANERWTPEDTERFYAYVPQFRLLS
jgi:hypothetical protein